MSESETIDPANLPIHIGIIMDGNGRWASQRNLVRTQGHLEGLKAAKRVVQGASNLGIRFVTLYTFSTENWKRTADEVGFLMGLVKQYLAAELSFYVQNKIRIRFTGDLSGLPKDIAGEIENMCTATSAFSGLTVILAMNYGGRDEIVRAVRSLVRDGKKGEDITEASLSLYLDNPDVPYPDLIIRTAAERRTSNFLLWEAAYAEYYFSDKYWPDWNESELSEAILDYQKRSRRFGGLSA